MLLLWLLLWLSKCRGRLLRSLLLLRLIRHLLCRHLLLLLRLRRRQLRKRRVLLRHLSIYLFRQRCVLLIHSKGMELTRLDSTVYKANSNQDGSRWNGKTKESCLRDRVLSWARCSFPVEFKLSRTPRYLATLVPDPRVRGGGKVDGRAVPTMKTAVLHGSMALASCLSVILAASINRRQKEAPTKKKQAEPCPASFPRLGRRAPWRKPPNHFDCSSFEEVPTGREERGLCVSLSGNTKRYYIARCGGTRIWFAYPTYLSTAVLIVELEKRESTHIHKFRKRIFRHKLGEP